MPKHFKVHELLDRKELDQLEEFAREPGRTVDEVHEWMQARGYTLSRSAAHTWLKQFLAIERFRSSNEVARTILDAAQKDVVAQADAAILQMGQMLFEQMLKLQQDGQLTSKDVWAMSASLKNTITSGRHLEKLRAETEEKQKRAVAEAEKIAKSGGSNEAVVSKVREILGIER